MGRFVMRKDREDQHCDLKVVLSKIAQGRNLQNPKLQAQIVINKLFRRIEDHRSTIAGARHYEHFVETCKAEIQAKENADQWLCYVIRLTNNKRTIGRRRGSAPRTTLALAIKDAATIANVSQLTPVEQRAFAILKGARRPTKSTKHPIERRALQLAKRPFRNCFGQACSSSSKALASFKSSVSKPSVNQLQTGASSSRACCGFP